MSDVKLTAPKLRVLMADGSVLDDLQCINFDMIMWERTRDRQKPKWPPMEEGRILWITFMAFQAARRTGAISRDMTWETFERDAWDVTPLVDDDEADDDGPGDPTQPGPDPG